MADDFLGTRADYLGAPARSAAAVTPHDSNEISVTRAVYVGGAGALVVRFANDSSNVTLSAVPAGALLPIRVKLVVSTGTVATNIVALY